jgi:DNA replication protein DnaC
MKKVSIDEAKKSSFYSDFIAASIPLGFIAASIKDYQHTWLQQGKHAEANMKNFKRYLDYIDNIGDRILNGIGLFISGSFGVGKTMLEIIAAKRAIEFYRVEGPRRNPLDYSFSMGFLTGAQLVGLFTFDNGQNVERRMRLPELDILIIDEMAKIPLTATNKEKVFIEDVLRSRAFSLKPTFLTSQGNVEQVGKDVSPAIPELIQEYFTAVHIVAPSYRENYDV